MGTDGASYWLVMRRYAATLKQWADGKWRPHSALASVPPSLSLPAAAAPAPAAAPAAVPTPRRREVP